MNSRVLLEWRLWLKNRKYFLRNVDYSFSFSFYVNNIFHWRRHINMHLFPKHFWWFVFWCSLKTCFFARFSIEKLFVLFIHISQISFEDTLLIVLRRGEQEIIISCTGDNWEKCFQSTFLSKRFSWLTKIWPVSKIGQANPIKL